MTVRGYTSGVFDLFHVGHLNILRRAADECDRLIVGVTTDELCLAMKGKRPVVPFEERVEIVRSMRFADEVVPQTSSSRTEAWEEHRFDVMFKGDDWRGTPGGDRMERELAAVGARVVYFPYTQQTSSTLLRAALTALA